MSRPQSVAFPPKDDRREHERAALALDGHLFVPAEESEQPCRVVDLSAGGAQVRCEDVPPCATYVILYVNGFGRFPAVTTRYQDGAIGLRFDMSEQKRQRLTAQIEAYLQGGILGVTDLRRHRRVAVPTAFSFQREDGQEVACAIRDFSLQGVFLETSARPPVGERITLGQHQGLVARHDKDGIGIQFISQAAKPGTES